jgi:hypothetical protein
VTVKILILCCAFWAAGWAARAAETATAQASAAADLASLLEGEFTTAPAPVDATASPPPVRPALYDLAKQVPTSPLGRYVVYAELREGATDGRILRQSLSVLNPDAENGQITMTIYGFANPAAYSGAYADPGLLAAVKSSDLKPGCTIVWHRSDAGFTGQAAGHCASATPAAAPASHFSVAKQGMTDDSTSFRRLR